MKVVHLVLAHHRPERFEALVDALNAPNSRIIAHVDAKSDIVDFRRASNGEANVTFVPDRDRLKVSWGGWSIVDATLRMMRLSLIDLEDEDRVVLLSGDSYPLQSARYIGNFLRRTPGVEYISGTELPSYALDKPLTRLSRLYVEYDPREAGRHALARTINRIGIPRNYRAALGTRSPFGGSQWWMLSGEAVRWLSEEVERDQRYVKFMHWTRIPDEHFFQTLLFNSPFSPRIRPSVMFTDWHSRPGPKPAVVDEQHVAELHQSLLRVHQEDGAGVVLFARKVIDARVESSIRRDLWSIEPQAD